MPKLSQDAIHELRQSLSLIGRLLHILINYSEEGKLPPKDEIRQLQKAYDRVSELTSPTNVEAWVGGSLGLIEATTEEITELAPTHKSSLPSTATERARFIRGVAERLHLYVQGILESEKLEETLNRLTQENASLKEQLAELRRRESTYLSIISEAQASATYSLPSKSREILLDSLQRQHATLTKNLCRLQEVKAQYGLNTPLDILNAIDQTQEDLNRIEASIADLEASTT